MDIGLIGIGAIGGYLAKELQKEGFKVRWVFDADEAFARERLRKLKIRAKFSKKPKADVDLVVEAASQAAVKEYVPALLKGTDVIVMSVGAFADAKLFKKVKAAAKRNKRKVYIPSGAIAGLDAVKSSRDFLDEVVLESRKNPKGFGRKDLKERLLYSGNARAACKLFPKNVNVSATLSLAGLGFGKTKVRIISDPKVRGNRHTIRAGGKAGKLLLRADNVPSPDNPKTSFLAALSALRVIRELNENIAVR